VPVSGLQYLEATAIQCWRPDKWNSCRPTSRPHDPWSSRTWPSVWAGESLS
jgi:hypothetical protein